MTIEVLKKKSNPRLTLEVVKERVNKLHPKLEILEKEYQHDQAHMITRCNECKHIWSPTYNNLRQGNGCPKCATTRNSVTQEQFEERMRKLNPNVTPLEPYTKALTKMYVQCNDCGLVWSSTPVNLYQGFPCKACKAKKKEIEDNSNKLKGEKQ